MTAFARLPRPLLLALFAAFAALFALPQVCFACSCLPPGPPLAALAEADAVFRGKVVEMERMSEGNRLLRVKIQVTSVWKGAVTTETLVQTTDNSAACGFPFQIGGDYLIYADTSTADTPNGPPIAPYTAHLCSRTRSIGQAADDLAALGPGQPPTPGLPNTGTGATTERIIPGELVIGGAILAFLAIVQRGRAGGRMMQQ
jgi:hypothetical protein